MIELTDINLKIKLPYGAGALQEDVPAPIAFSEARRKARELKARAGRKPAESSNSGSNSATLGGGEELAVGKTKSDVFDYSQSFWVGCHSVSQGCVHCYARAQVEGYGRDFDKVVHTETWDDPIKWNRAAAKVGEVKRVFTCSWSDFFHPGADQWRAEAWSVIKNTPNLFWHVLTKRAELIADRLPENWGEGYPNVCLGVTVEMKKYLWRIDTLRKIPARARYMVAEPLLEDLMPELERHVEGFHWIVVGGESGNGTDDFLPMDERWARNIRDLCAAKHIPFHCKQHS